MTQLKFNDDGSVNTVPCSYCGSLENEDDIYETPIGFLCYSCYCEHSTCERCGAFSHTSETRWVDVVNDRWCDYCVDNFAIECSNCNDLVPERVCTDVSNGEETVCPDCYESYYYPCDYCGEMFHEDDMCPINGLGNVCPSCEENSVNDIMAYDYRPTPIFYGGVCRGRSTYYGVELEIDGGGASNHNANKISEIINAGDRVAYFKHDSSLDRGFEIVTHPATLDYHLNSIPYRDVFREALSMDYTSHNARTCGLHVHVGRDGLGETYVEQDLTIMKILYIVEKHWDKMVKFSRRTPQQLDRWAERYLNDCYDLETLNEGYDGAEKILYKAKNSRSRYKCINLRNRDTIEFRFFRGTLKYNTFVATLQFVELLCDLARELGISDVVELTWSDIISYSSKYTELLTYLQERQLV